MAVTLPCDPGPAPIGSVPLQGCWRLPCPAALNHPEGPGRVIVLLWSEAIGSPHSWFQVPHGAQLPGHPHPLGCRTRSHGLQSSGESPAYYRRMKEGAGYPHQQ